MEGADNPGVRTREVAVLPVAVVDDKLHVRKDVLSGQGTDSESESSPSESSDEDLLPDVFTRFEPQPHDNDSSDYGAEAEDEEMLGEEASHSSVEESKGKGISRKHGQSFSAKKSIKSADAKIESKDLRSKFYTERVEESKPTNEDDKAIVVPNAKKKR